jgi:tetratricopeptide (TPR) repeat protein
MPKQKALHIEDPVAAGRRLREARERAGLTQRDLAHPYCTAAYVSRIEAGARSPSLQLLREFGRRLGVSADWLATGASSESEARLVEAEIAVRLGDLEQARSLYEAELERDPGPAAHSEILEGLGRIALREERHRDAINRFEESLELTGDDPAARPALAESLARAYAALGELAPAIALLRHCCSSLAAAEDPIAYVRFASLLGYALTDIGDFDEAEHVLASALETGRDVADPYTRARLYWSQSRLLAELGQIDQAERYARRTLETLRVTEDTYAIAHILETLAHICIEQGRPSEALEVLAEGKQMIEIAGTPIEVAHYRLEEARALAALDEKERAGALAMEVAGELQAAQPTSVGRAYLLLAEVFEEIGEASRAKELYELSIELLDRQGPSKHVVRAYRRLADLLKAEGRRDEALDLLERALKIQESAGRMLR